MTDIVDKATRSRMMSGIRAKNTKPEIFMRKGLHALGFRFRLHVKEIPGKPDMVFPRYRALIMIHGCFWHGHTCRFFKLPSSNREFWLHKIRANKQRDEKALQMQIAAGWRCLVVWECAIKASKAGKTDGNAVNLAAGWLQNGGSDSIMDESGIHMMNVLRWQDWKIEKDSQGLEDD